MAGRSENDELEEIRARLERLEAEVARLAGEQTSRPAREPGSPAPPAAVAPAVAKPPAAVAPPAVELPATTFEKKMHEREAEAPSAATPSAAPRAERSPVVAVAIAGAGIFLLGAIFMLRFAIQEGWIGPGLRFLFGLVVGGGLAVAASRYLLRGVPKLGTALLAAGLGTLEFTLYVGAFRYGFYGASAGFFMVGLGCLAAGALAVRTRVSAAFLVAYLAAFISPFVFSTGARRLIALSAFEIMLLSAAVLVAHLAPESRRWGVTRWVVAATQGLLQFGLAAEARSSEEPKLALLLLAGTLLAAIWIWRPEAPARPATSPTLLWISASVVAIAAAALHWKQMGWSDESFALPVLIFAAIHLALVGPARRGWAPAGAEAGLIVVAGAFTAAAVPIALDWRWVGPLWGTLAVGSFFASRWLLERGEEVGAEVRGLRIAGFGLACVTSLRWVVASGERLLSDHHAPTPFLNEIFVTAVLASLAWALLARSEGSERWLGFIALQGVANLALALEIAELVGWLGGSDHARLVTVTLVWATSGAAQWLIGLRRPHAELRRGLIAAGYVGLAAAAGKLVFLDMEQASLAQRALVFLVAGGIFLGAALTAHRLEERARSS